MNWRTLWSRFRLINLLSPNDIKHDDENQFSSSAAALLLFRPSIFWWLQTVNTLRIAPSFQQVQFSRSWPEVVPLHWHTYHSFQYLATGNKFLNNFPYFSEMSSLTSQESLDQYYDCLYSFWCIFILILTIWWSFTIFTFLKMWPTIFCLSARNISA